MTIENILLENKAIKESNKIGLAVSGGVDSIALLAAFNSIKKKIKANLFVLHFDHGWREDAVKDYKLINNFCKKNKLKFIFKKASGKLKHTEENARKERYKFLADAYKNNDLDYICTAHHFNDQVETILFRIFRGTGPSGLNPIKEQIELNNSLFLRPLLSVKKEDLFTYVKNKKLKFNEDYTNKNLKYKRNYIRLEIIPKLLEINPKAMENIVDLALMISTESLIAKRALMNLLIRTNKVDRNKFLSLPFEEQKLFLYYFFSESGLRRSIAGINTYIKSIKNKKNQDLSSGLRLTISENDFYLTKQKRCKNK